MSKTFSVIIKNNSSIVNIFILIISVLFLFMITTCLSDYIYCMDEITESILKLENKIKQVEVDYSYWKDQAKLMDNMFKDSLINGDSGNQKEILSAKKETENNLNTESLTLKSLKAELKDYVSHLNKFTK